MTIWEPMLFEQADGQIGQLIRNSTAQDNPERAEKPCASGNTAISLLAASSGTDAMLSDDSGESFPVVPG